MRSATSLPPECFDARLRAVRDVVAGSGCRTLVGYSRPRIQGGGGLVHWLCGWTPLRSASLVVVSTDRPPVAVTDGPNEVRVFAQTLGERGSAVRAGSLEVTLSDLLDEGPVATCGFDALPGAALAAVKTIMPAAHALDAELNSLRLAHLPREIALHQRGAEISIAMIETAMKTFQRPGATPADILVETEFRGRQLGADFSSLWLAVGERPPFTCFELCELPDRIAEHDRIQLGTTVSVEGHYAQLLRTGARDGGSSELRQLYSALVDLQDAALASLQIGTPLSRLGDVLEAGIDLLCPYSRATDPFRFQSCHVLGVDYAEPAAANALSPDRDRSRDREGPYVAPGMVIEIHPNFTLPGLGHVATGDMALVTEDGPVWMGEFPRGLISLP